ncbi:hypothetical protein [Bradyrhizobium sp. USDA 3262]
MKPIDLLEQFDKSNGAVGFIATYEFDPQFFERRILTKKSFGSAERLVVFMDRARYQELVDNGLGVSGFNRRYLVIPVGRAPYVFHPKLYLTLGEKRADALIGSSNCTSAGIGYNLELCSGFSVSEGAPKSDEQHQRAIIRQVYEAMKAFTADAGPLRELIETEFFRSAENLYPWLDPRVAVPPGDITLLHSHEAPLWKQLVARIDKESVRRITIVSPFYDRDLGFIKQLRAQWPKAKLSIVAQPQYATLAGEKLADVFKGGKHELLAASPQPGRRLHAKAFAFETSSGTYWFTGSANATRAAFNGRNTEAGFLLETKEGAEFLLKESGLKLKRLDPRKFQAGHDDEPASVSQPRALVLHSAVLDDNGLLVCEVNVASGIDALTLRVRNYNEPLPMLSAPLRRQKGDTVSLELSETQIEQIRVAAVCDIKGISGSGTEVLSNGVALVQVYHLLRERPGSHGGGNPLRRIEETGENLVSYVESLGSVREAVEFFNNCSIRFFDGEGTGRGSKGTFWRPRDPFKPDAPPNWLNIRLGGSPADLRAAIEDFVERHQSDRLYRHVRRANLNGLSNFLDIFRTLNSLLFAYHSRTAPRVGPIIPFGVVTRYVMINIELLIGPYEPREDAYEGNGFISAVYANFAGDRAIVRDRLKEERVPQMLCAAMEAMLRVRAKARKMDGLDDWAARRVRWITAWIKAQGQPEPKREDIEAAGLEYLPGKRAA